MSWLRALGGWVAASVVLSLRLGHVLRRLTTAEQSAATEPTGPTGPTGPTEPTEPTGPTEQHTNDGRA